MDKQDKSPDFEVAQPSSDTKNEALDWFLRLKEDRAADTLVQFEFWLNADPARTIAYQQLQNLFAMPSLKQATRADALLQEQHRHAVASKRWFWKRPHIVAPIVACLSLIVIACLQFSDIALWWKADYQTAYGEQQLVNLPDGSTALLNTDTAIAVDFHDDTRRIVLLKGEAFFDVEHDTNRPFIVSSHYSNVRVTGTAFSVRTDKMSDAVILERGSVEVSTLNHPNISEQLRAGETVTISGDTFSPVQKTDLALDLAWKNGRIIFRELPFANALTDLTRYYSGSVFVLANQSALPVVSGNYRIDDPEAAIRTLATSSNLNITRLPGNIYILR